MYFKQEVYVRHAGRINKFKWNIIIVDSFEGQRDGGRNTSSLTYWMLATLINPLCNTVYFFL